MEERISGLDGGAGDYVLKPFEMAELLARMRAAPAELKTMFKNLVENAIQHSPVNGRIDILVRRGAGWDGGAR
ncbi:hypothetical protein [Acidocella sp.]|uniref:hypothetical protein n=1 Tax=Acidocella sp. TaxID=50710 RepID=UPI002635D471|nr:hypothetical protein [Acidocella sp.]MDD2795373.1 hypothetical protein [Acidocella sp.]